MPIHPAMSNQAIDQVASSTPSEVIDRLGQIAARTLLLPIAPQWLIEEERNEIVGGMFGWDLIGEKIHPEVAWFTSRFGGGRFDGMLKAKLQTWFAGWVTPPPYYAMHFPRVASGQWIRLFRSGLFIKPELDAAMRDASLLSRQELESKYAYRLGPATRDRFPDHKAWWETVLEVIRMGSWHISVYSPAYESFVSPFAARSASRSSDGNDLLTQCRDEFPAAAFRLYPTGEPSEGPLDLSALVYSGAVVEIFGELLSAPPFGQAWGDGVSQDRPGASEGLIIGGVVHHGPERNQAFTVKAQGKGDIIAMDPPDPYTFLQDVYAVTGWRPPDVPREALLPEGLESLRREHRERVTGADMSRLLYLPKDVFLDAVHLNPRLMPVYGRLQSVASKAVEGAA